MVEFKDLIPWNWGRAGMDPQLDRPDPLRSLQAEVNRAFETFWQSFPGPLPGPRMRANWGMSFEGVEPRIDVAETEREIEVTAELPGVEESAIEVGLTEDALTIQAQKRVARDEQGRDYRILERSHGLIRRSIPIPSGVEPANVKATFKNGLLVVTITKPAGTTKPVTRIAVSKD